MGAEAAAQRMPCTTLGLLNLSSTGARRGFAVFKEVLRAGLVFWSGDSARPIQAHL